MGNDKKCKIVNTCKSVHRCLACYGVPDCYKSTAPGDKILKKLYADIKEVTGSGVYTMGEIKEIFAIGHNLYKNKSGFLKTIQEKITEGKEMDNEKPPIKK